MYAPVRILIQGGTKPLLSCRHYMLFVQYPTNHFWNVGQSNDFTAYQKTTSCHPLSFQRTPPPSAETFLEGFSSASLALAKRIQNLLDRPTD
jgi:hypothetical protein